MPWSRSKASWPTMTRGSARLDAVLRRPVVLGAYAIPGNRSRRMTAPRPRPEVLDISPYVGGESTVPGVNRVLKLSSNEGAFGVPPGAQEAYKRAAEELHRYPDGDATELRRAIGARFKLDPARIVCGAGSDDLIYQLCLAYGGHGPRHRHERARLRDLLHRRHLRRQPGDQDAGAQR